METEISKLEIIEMLIHTTKEDVLQKVRKILEDNNEYDYDDDFYAMLNERRERYMKGESKGIPWEEVEDKIRNSSRNV